MITDGNSFYFSLLSCICVCVCVCVCVCEERQICETDLTHTYHRTAAVLLFYCPSSAVENESVMKCNIIPLG